MTAFGTIETAVDAMKAGAADFLLKPFSLEHLMTVSARRSICAPSRTRTSSCARSWATAMSSITSSAIASHAGDLLHCRARRATRATVLLAGESGRWQGSHRPRHPLPFPPPRPPLRQDQLHRHPREPDGERVVRLREGRFYRANSTKPGKFELADTGTAFLDEIATCRATFR